MIESLDKNQKAVPVKKEAKYHKTTQKLFLNKNFQQNFVKKLKSISEQQIIGNP